MSASGSSSAKAENFLPGWADETFNWGISDWTLVLWCYGTNADTKAVADIDGSMLKRDRAVAEPEAENLLPGWADETFNWGISDWITCRYDRNSRS